jgi:hypothetical protein
MKHTWACTCGENTECVPVDDQWLGSVFQCPACKGIWGCVSGNRGQAWVWISKDTAEFHGLFEEDELLEEE